MVSIKCQSQYTTLLLASSSLTVTGDRAGGAGGQAPSSPRTEVPAPAGGVREPSTGCGAGTGSGRCRNPAVGPGGGRLKQIHGLHFCRLPGVGMGGWGGWKLRAHKTSLPLPFFSAVRVTSLYGQRKK